MQKCDVIVVGSGNAALCAGISALEHGARVLIVEKATFEEMGGNSRYTAGAMRFAYDSNEDLLPLLKDPNDERIAITDFGSYPKEKFLADLKHFNEGEPITELQQFLVDESLPALQWLATHHIKFAPIYSRQSFMKDGKYIFWGGLTLEAEGEGNGLVMDELKRFQDLGGTILYDCAATEIVTDKGKIVGLTCHYQGQDAFFETPSVILGCGGFEANKELRIRYLGDKWGDAKVRGTRHNLGHGLTMATQLGAALNGYFGGCHATPMDRYMPEYGNLNIPHIERKHYRKISYLFGVMLNANGERFVDEGADFRNYTYAQFGKAVLEQPLSIAWQIFDAKVWHLLYGEYKTSDASFVEANTLEELVAQLTDVNPQQALETLRNYNAAVRQDKPFDPTIKDGRCTEGLTLNKTNWANVLDTPPFRAYPVTGGITFTYGGLKVNQRGEVLNTEGVPIAGLFACGEMVGGVFFHGYPGGSGLTSGTIFGRYAGQSAAQFCSLI
ncbi:MAG: FAD-dependent tricarballylate dehydrogenase TcuA [Saprospiraceae bacterium]|nr:FAD-dependent tricarballylate dehydrogenase TcuA [Saprospiraceae bacterium]